MGENPLRERRSWIFPAVLAAGGLLIPVLLSKLFLISISVQMLGVMVATPFLGRLSGKGELRRAIVGLLCPREEELLRLLDEEVGRAV